MRRAERKHAAHAAVVRLLQGQTDTSDGHPQPILFQLAQAERLLCFPFSATRASNRRVAAVRCRKRIPRVDSRSLLTTSAFSSAAPRGDRIRVEEQRGAPLVLAPATEAGAEAAITTVADAPPRRLGRALHALGLASVATLSKSPSSPVASGPPWP